MNSQRARGVGDVVVGYVHSVDVAVTFHASMLALQLFDHNGPKRTLRVNADCTEFACIAEYSSANVSTSRNKVVDRFLDEFDQEWLWMVDTDMVFEADVLEALLFNASGDKDSDHFAPIVGGLCFAVNQGKLEPTMYQLREGEGGELYTVRYTTYPKDSMFQVSATGAACLLIHRSVLEALRAAHKGKTAYPYFQETQLGPGHAVGEDVTFCFRAIQAGFPVWVNTAVHIGHQKAFIADYKGHVAQVGNPHEETADV